MGIGGSAKEGGQGRSMAGKLFKKVHGSMLADGAKGDIDAYESEDFLLKVSLRGWLDMREVTEGGEGLTKSEIFGPVSVEAIRANSVKTEWQGMREEALDEFVRVDRDVLDDAAGFTVSIGESDGVGIDVKKAMV